MKQNKEHKTAPSLKQTLDKVCRGAQKLWNTLSVHQAFGPAAFLGVSAVLGVSLVLTTLYSTSYAVTVNGQPLGRVADQAVVAQAIQEVEATGTSLLGYDYEVSGEIDYQFGLALKTELADQETIENYFYDQLDEVSDDLRQCEVLVNGRSVGVVEDEDALNQVMNDIKAQYVTEDTVEAAFVEDVTINYVYASQDLMTMEEMKAALEENSTGETTYIVESGDTFNGIAYANDMSVSELKALNPDININWLMIGDVINVKEIIPVLSVQTKERQGYTQAIECPVETQDDPDLYVGDSKVLVQGEEGEAWVEANVIYVNGYERDREIVSETTLREPTTTLKAVGTKPRPKTASTGDFAWPIRGKINSYFGGRYIFGSYSYHSGLDISADYGDPIKAADGGTVTYSGWKGSYGKLVIITHDNGVKSYYAHNSSLVVSVGDKVYKGQTIAKAGSTGRSTGVHCHFEVRVNNTAVNPLNYLP